MPLGLNKLRIFNNVYQGKKILVTCHTGFKGSWLTTWLLKLGANKILVKGKFCFDINGFERIIKLRNIK